MRTLLLCLALASQLAAAQGNISLVATAWDGKYHLRGCEMLSKFDGDRQISFTSRAAARAAGFSPCPVCLSPRGDSLQGERRTLSNYWRYEDQKMEPFTGFILSFIFPGGGLFYADEPVLGGIFLVAEGVEAYTVLKKGVLYNQSAAPLSLVLTKVAEYVLVLGKISRYNRDLRRSVGLDVSMDERGSTKLTLMNAF